jgi:hypothetical protein
MYPKYLEMGYNPKEFIKNGLELKTSISDLKGIRLKLLWFYKAQSINLFIGCLFSILADHVKENNYTEHHQFLKNNDTILYEVIKDFWNKWMDFDIENIDPIYNSDLELTDSLINALKIWTNNKIII